MVLDIDASGRSALLLDQLMEQRPRRAYNPDEQRFSVLVQQRLDELLRGDRNDLMLLRLYPAAPGRMGVMATPARINRAALRPDVVRELMQETLLFLAAGSPGGPAAQQPCGAGCLVERRYFPTKYAHIVIEREDRFDAAGCTSRTWCARRVQNQREQTQINRLLDLANLGFEVMESLLR